MTYGQTALKVLRRAGWNDIGWNGDLSTWAKFAQYEKAWNDLTKSTTREPNVHTPMVLVWEDWIKTATARDLYLAQRVIEQRPDDKWYIPNRFLLERFLRKKYGHDNVYLHVRDKTTAKFHFFTVRFANYPDGGQPLPQMDPANAGWFEIV